MKVRSLFLVINKCIYHALVTCCCILLFPQRIIQNSFIDGVANPCDAESIKNYIVKNEGALSGYPGSCYLLAQKFEFNWTVLGNMDKVIT